MLTKTRSFLYLVGLIVMVLVMAFALEYALPEHPMQGEGNCGTDWIAKDESAPFVYDGDQIITKVAIKASTECTVFNYDGGSSIRMGKCYVVTGLGTTHVKVAMAVNAPRPECHDISHVEFYAGEIPPTNTRAPTFTPTGTLFPTMSLITPTEATPFKFWTFTPTVPSVTVTPTGTATQPSEATDTPTSTTTQPPEITKKPPTPKTTATVILPNTGEGPPNDGGGFVFPAVFLALLVIVVAVFVLSGTNKNGKGGTEL